LEGSLGGPLNALGYSRHLNRPNKAIHDKATHPKTFVTDTAGPLHQMQFLLKSTLGSYQESKHCTKSVRFTDIFHTRYFQKDTPVSEWNVESPHHNTDQEKEALETLSSQGSRAEPLGDAIQNGTCKELIQVLNDPDKPKGGYRNQYHIVKKDLAFVQREIDENPSDFVVYG
jgi:hypothetical protein